MSDGVPVGGLEGLVVAGVVRALVVEHAGRGGCSQWLCKRSSVSAVEGGGASRLPS